MAGKLPLVLAAVAALAAAGCSTSPCQRLGERLCGCTGIGTDVCTAQVEDQLKGLNPSEDVLDACQKALDACNAPNDTVIFCEWINTPCGKASCGLSVQDPAAVCQP